MAGKRLTVVLSQTRSKNPAKRQLEEEILTALLFEPTIEVAVIPHLYDLYGDDTGTLFLRSIAGPMVVLGWLYPRALFWVVQRQGIAGVEHKTALDTSDEAEDEEELEAAPLHSATPADLQSHLDNNSNGYPANGNGQGHGNGMPNGSNGQALAANIRPIYCLDLRSHENATIYVDEIRRILSHLPKPVASLAGPSLVQLSPTPAAAPPTASKTDTLANGLPTLPILLSSSPVDKTLMAKPLPALTNLPTELPTIAEAELAAVPSIVELYANAQKMGKSEKRRWYPVIDYSRCTNCMECIDFCLFGVYGLDQMDRILVEQQDNCRKGCPACSRVCPANAIIFPEHKTPAIAGAAGEGPATLKIDLSKLFGAPDAVEQAAMERDLELIKAGRTPVGAAESTATIPKRQTGLASKPKDDLDRLVDQLDQFPF